MINLTIDPVFHMCFVLALTVLAVVLFIREKSPLEITSVVLLTILLVFGQIFPIMDEDGKNALGAAALLAGFANPSLIAVLALLVMGQAIIHSDALHAVTNMFLRHSQRYAWVCIIGILLFVTFMSAFLNNTPLVIIVIPIIQALAKSTGMSDSRLMIPLSYVAILGGMMTLIGSSTNLLVSSTMAELGFKPLEFFDFVVPGAILAGIGFLYVILVVPRILSDRARMSKGLVDDEKEFVAEMDIAADSKLIGMECKQGQFPELYNLNVKLIQRGGHLILPPFEGYKIEAGDIMIVAASRDALTEILSKHPGFLLSEEEEALIENRKSSEDGENTPVDEAKSAETRVLAEIMITPASRMLDMTLDHANFERQFGTIVLGIQRRARVVRRRLGRIRLEPGDVLLVAGERSNVNALRDNTDFIVLSGSKRDMPVPRKAPVAIGIFICVVVLAAFNILSIPVAAIAGAVMMIITGCLNIRQATRAIDRKIFILVGSMLALGSAMQATGGAHFLAETILSLPFANTPLIIASLLFILVALATNVLTNNACAILFTPIAMNLAESIPLPEGATHDLSFIFAVTVVFAANCSFASPIGYQTNLLVMGPGHYRFRDFIKAGVPLMLIMWGAYTAIARYYFGL